MPSTTAHKPRKGPRGLSKEDIVTQAVALMEDSGEARFSVRRLAERLGCDPMSVLYHFRAKEGLQRAMADHLSALLRPVDDSLPWETRLQALAGQYRQLARDFPNTFGLMQQFLHTGAADFQAIESVQLALRDAGLRDAQIPIVCLGWYAAVIGLAMGEVRGLIRAASPQELAETASLPGGAYPMARKFMPLLQQLDQGAVHATTLALLHDGIRALAARGA